MPTPPNSCDPRPGAPLGAAPRGRRRLTDWSSKELAIAAQGGDGEAAGELYRRVGRRAQRAARGFCREVDVDDAVAEGLSKALRRIGQLREPATVEAWMVRCVVRAAIDVSRQGHRLLPSDAVYGLVDRTTRPWDGAAEAALLVLEHDSMADAVRQLPPCLRQLLYLRYDAGLTVEHIATELGRPAGTVRRQCAHARRMAGQGFLYCHLRPAAGVCARVTEMLCAEPYRQPSPRGRRRTTEHLRGCPACRERKVELAAVITELGYRRPPAPASVRGGQEVPAPP
jgi:RNA polymerase sigma-70 factor (ECF subfamily)